MLDKILKFIDNHFIRLFYKTMRFNRKNMTEWEGQKKNHWWTRGTELVVILTGRCSLHCSYCPMFITDDKYPYASKENECTFEEWKTWFEEFPEWISLIHLSGGEPTLIPYLSELTNWLINRGHRVTIFSNLHKPENLMGIKDHWRFILVPTFHYVEGEKGYDNKERFEAAYNKVKGRFRISAQELQENAQLNFTKHKNFYSEEWFKYQNKLYHVAPDAPRTGKIFLGCDKAYQDGK